MDGVDRGEYLIAAGSVDREALADQVVALGDQPAVPAGVILLAERDQLPIPHAGLTPGLGEQQQPEQTGHLRLLGEQLAEDPCQPDGLAGELGAHRVAVAGGEVALVEDEEQYRQHAAEPLGEVGGLGYPVGHLRRRDLLLRPSDPLRHRGLGHEERLRDLSHGQLTEEAERQRDPRLRCERRVAAGEQQPQSVVLDWSGVLVGRVVVVHEGRLVLRAALLLAADPVDRAVARGGGEPAAGVGRYAELRPLLQRGHERLTRRLLRDVDVTEAADERGDQSAVLLAENPLDGCRSALHHCAVFGGRRSGRLRRGRRTDGPRPCPGTPWTPRPRA